MNAEKKGAILTCEFFFLDINECAENTFICPNGNCQNFMGGYQCACFNGFISSDDMKSCIGKGRWSLNFCRYLDCDYLRILASTTNFFLDASSFIMDYLTLFIFFFPDVDECATDNGRCQASCENTIGSYRCSCPIGLRLRDDLRSCAGTFWL